VYSQRNLIYGFASIMILTTFLGITAIYTMMKMSTLTEKMYKHPFSVSKAILHVQVDTAQIQYQMQKIVKSGKSVNVQEIAKLIHKPQESILANYKLIFERYLGDTQDIKKSYNLLIECYALNKQIIHNFQDHDAKSIDNLQLQKMQKQKTLEKLLDKIETFANNKAITYHNNAQNLKKEYIVLLVSLFMLIGVLSTIITIVVLKNSLNKSNEIKKYFLLIEQNVNIATCNLDSSLIEVTHSLARLVNSTKDVLLSSKSNPFLGEDKIQIAKILNTIASLQSYKGEIRLRLHDGMFMWIYADIQPVLDSQLKPLSYTMIINDITNKKELEVVSRTDGMTELFNRREFDNSFKTKINIAKREKKLLNFMMLDIDFFKLYNDNYGHQCGDVALKSVALCLKKSFTRANDGVYRLGGEEFGVLFSTNTREDAIDMSLKVLEAVESLKIPHKHSQVNENLTVSIGIGSIEEYKLSDAEIYLAVDTALYKAKNAGRNRYVSISI